MVCEQLPDAAVDIEPEQKRPPMEVRPAIIVSSTIVAGDRTPRSEPYQGLSELEYRFDGSP